jgi:hypothetical protein
MASTGASTTGSTTGGPGSDTSAETTGDPSSDTDSVETTGSSLVGNVVFLSSTAIDPSELDASLSAADTHCNTLAGEAGLAGTYVAWVSSGTAAASERLAGARGWQRVDGLPVADRIEDLQAGLVWHPIDLDETGARVASAAVLTGTGAAGGAAQTCLDWTTNQVGEVYTVGSTGHGFPGWTSFSEQDCQTGARVYCFGVDSDVLVAPTVVEGRTAFVSRATFTGDAGVAAMDAACATEASDAGLPGSFAALVAMGNDSAADRVTPDGSPWVNAQGVAIVPDGGQLTDADPLVAPLSFTADGMPVDETVWIGGDGTSHCDNWGNTSTDGRVTQTDQVAMWPAYSQANCTEAHPVYCFEE